MKAGIQAIIEKITEEAQEHSAGRYEQIKNDIDGEINGENVVYHNEQVKRREILIKNNEYEYARRFEQLGSRFNREILKYQHELTDEIFDMAVSKLKEAPKAEFLNMLKSAIRELARERRESGFTLYFGEFSCDKLEKAEIEKAVKDTGGVKISISSEFISKKSGFVISDDEVEYNCLFEDLIEDKKNELTAEIFTEVFGGFDAGAEL